MHLVSTWSEHVARHICKIHLWSIKIVEQSTKLITRHMQLVQYDFVKI